VPWIIVKKGIKDYLRFEIEKNEILVGRDSECDIILDINEVSRKHARILVEGDTYRIVDCNSSNGTYVNSQKINDAEISPGDIINISHFSLMIKEEDTETIVPMTLDEDKSDRTGELIGILIEEDSEGEKKSFNVYDPFTIGRDENNDICISLPEISRKHVTISLKKGEPVITDHNTPNGTQINEENISGTVTLSQHDIIHIGSRKWKFESEFAKIRSQSKGGLIQKYLPKPIHKGLAIVGLLVLLMMLVLPKQDKNKILALQLVKKAKSYEQEYKYLSALNCLIKVNELYPESQSIIDKIDELTKKIEFEKIIGRIKLMIETNDYQILSDAESMILELLEQHEDQDVLNQMLISVRQNLEYRRLVDQFFSLYNSGQYRDCIELFKDSSHPEKKKYIVEAYSAYARRLENYGRNNSAKQQWRKLLEIDSENSEAKDALERLNKQTYVAKSTKRVEKRILNKSPVVGQIQYLKEQIMKDQTLQLSIKAEDSDNDPLKYQWSTDRGSIQSLDEKAIYRADFEMYSDEELVKIQVEVTDMKNIPIQRKAYITVLTEKMKNRIEAVVSDDQVLSESIQRKEKNITEADKRKAEKLYRDAIKRMSYRNKEAYEDALKMFREVVELVPDENFSYYSRAMEKIQKIQLELSKY
jgi:pSer/pThr/pTyr-binding forkhead associated (FHA) protein